MLVWVLFVQCCDHRVQVAAQNLRKHLGIIKGHYDPISVPGGAANIEVLRSSMAKLSPIRLTTRRAVLTVHEDCAVGATIDDLVAAMEVASEFFPEVHGYLLKLDGTFELIKQIEGNCVLASA